jgi:tetratricopeptide (TPR) repeat protein
MNRPAAATANVPPTLAAPPLLRDPWVWVSALSVLPLVLHSLGAPLGEPVAEDFDFLRHWRLLGQHSLLDGGGSLSFWRPVAHQLYYGALGTLILEHPRLVAALHAVLLAVSAMLIHRALRPQWSGPQAAVAASFPFLTESVRTVIAWPSHGVELGSLLFAALALHEAARRRLATCLVALLLGLLCKELVVVAALLIPLLPGWKPRERARWMLATGVLTAAWALVYLYVRRTAGLALPHNLESDPSNLAVPFMDRMVWAAWNSARALISLPATAGAGDSAWGWAAAAVVAVAVVLFALLRSSRARLRGALPWFAVGLAWFALSSAALTTMFPIWAPNRVLFGSIGLGIALAALLAAAHPLLPIALVALRLAAFAVSPGPSRAVDFEAAPTGAFMDFAQITRLQRLMADTRGALLTANPTLPHGAQVGQRNMPRRAEYAFGGDRALQVWYGDTTLRWVRFETYSRDTTIRLAAIAEYQLGYRPQLALVEPAAMSALLRGLRLMEGGDPRGALAALDVAEAAQRDPAARVFLGTVGSKRAVCRMGIGDREGALDAASRSLAVWRENPDSRYVMAAIGTAHGELAEAEAQLDTLLAIYPGDTDAQALRERIRKLRGAERVP